MPYSDKEYKQTNVNYLNKDFNSLKRSLLQYAKSLGLLYFLNSNSVTLLTLLSVHCAESIVATKSSCGEL